MDRTVLQGAPGFDKNTGPTWRTRYLQTAFTDVTALRHGAKISSGPRRSAEEEDSHHARKGNH